MPSVGQESRPERRVAHRAPLAIAALLVGCGVASAHAAPSPQDPEPAPIPDVPAPRAVLRDYATHKNYPDAAYSFERAYGGAERTGKPKVRNDWDIVFQGGVLRADTVADDKSLLVDLGVVPLAELTRRPLAEFERRVGRAAAARYDARADRRPPVTLPAQLGHTYFVWTDDTDSDVASLFEIVELVPGDRCVLDWYSTEDGTFARGSLRNPTGERSLVAVALGLRAVAERMRAAQTVPLDMREPRIVVQARSGAIGGNPCRIDLARAHSAYFDELVGEPIATAGPVGIDERPVGYCSGGRIPKGYKLVITNVAWVGEAHGDSNGNGCFWVQLGDLELVKFAAAEQPARGGWSGRIELLPGQEDRAFLEISNSSCGEVVFSGRFEKLPDSGAERGK